MVLPVRSETSAVVRATPALGPSLGIAPAGLLRGDVIVAFGAIEIGGMGDYMYALNAHKPGDVITVRFLRDGTEETAQVTLESNQVE